MLLFVREDSIDDSARLKKYIITRLIQPLQGCGHSYRLSPDFHPGLLTFTPFGLMNFLFDSIRFKSERQSAIDDSRLTKSFHELHEPFTIQN